MGLSTLIKYLALIGALLLAVVPAIVRAADHAGPGDGGGGGSTIEFPEQRCPFLLDLLINKNEFTSDSDLEVAVDCPLGRPMDDTDPLEIEKLRPADLLSKKAAHERLQVWLNFLAAASIGAPELRYSLVFVATVDQALMTMPYLRTKFALNDLHRYPALPRALAKRHPRVVPVILYTPVYGAIISDDAWDAAGFETQTGLMIHEALRQAQIGEYRWYIDDATLQTLVTYLLAPVDPSVASAMVKILLGDVHMWAELSVKAQCVSGDMSGIRDANGNIDSMRVIHGACALGAPQVASFLNMIDGAIHQGQLNYSNELVNSNAAARDAILGGLYCAGYIKVPEARANSLRIYCP